MDTLRTSIPIFLCMLMDRKDVEVTFKNNMIFWKSKSSSGNVLLSETGEYYGARAIEIGRELFLLCAECEGEE